MTPDATDSPATLEDLHGHLLLMEVRQRAELYRALLIASLVIIGSLTAILAALTQL